MRRKHSTDPEEGTCSVADSSMDDNSRNSWIDTYSDRNSSSGSDMSELAIHTLLVETGARDLDREVYQDPDSDRYLIQVKESLTTQQIVCKKWQYRNVR